MTGPAATARECADASGGRELSARGNPFDCAAGTTDGDLPQRCLRAARAARTDAGPGGEGLPQLGWGLTYARGGLAVLPALVPLQCTAPRRRAARIREGSPPRRKAWLRRARPPLQAPKAAVVVEAKNAGKSAGGKLKTRKVRLARPRRMACDACPTQQGDAARSPWQDSQPSTACPAADPGPSTAAQGSWWAQRCSQQHSAAGRTRSPPVLSAAAAPRRAQPNAAPRQAGRCASSRRSSNAGGVGGGRETDLLFLWVRNRPLVFLWVQAASKRFKLSGSGKLMARHSGKQHMNEKQTTNKKRWGGGGGEGVQGRLASSGRGVAGASGSAALAGPARGARGSGGCSWGAGPRRRRAGPVQDVSSAAAAAAPALQPPQPLRLVPAAAVGEHSCGAWSGAAALPPAGTPPARPGQCRAAAVRLADTCCLPAGACRELSQMFVLDDGNVWQVGGGGALAGLRGGAVAAAAAARWLGSGEGRWRRRRRRRRRRAGWAQGRGGGGGGGGLECQPPAAGDKQPWLPACCSALLPAANASRGWLPTCTPPPAPPVVAAADSPPHLCGNALQAQKCLPYHKIK